MLFNLVVKNMELFCFSGHPFFSVLTRNVVIKHAENYGEVRLQPLDLVLKYYSYNTNL